MMLRDQSVRKDRLSSTHTTVAGWLLDQELVCLHHTFFCRWRCHLNLRKNTIFSLKYKPGNVYFKDTLIIKVHQYLWFKYSRTRPGDTLHTGDTELMTAWPCNLLVCLTEWSVSSSATHLCPYQGAQHRHNQESQGVPGEISLVPVFPMKISSQGHLKKMAPLLRE